MHTKSVWLILLTGLLLASIKLNAIPASPYPIKITQPDGTEITIRLRGDEYFKYKTTLDGYALIDDAKGFLTYAQQDTNGNLVTTNVRANDIANRNASELEFLKQLTPNISFTKQNIIQRAQRAIATATKSSVKSSYPLGGTPKSLVILVNFKDKSFITNSPLTAFTNLLNQTGYSANGGTGSARDYFSNNSMGTFNPQFDVVGPYTLPNAMAYYGGNDTSGSDKNPRQMVIDACTLASAAGVDFSQYDTDGDGFVDNVFIYYAGNNEAEGASANTVWPHRWTLADYTTKFNGKTVLDYACTSELRGSSGSNMCGVGTFCHEFGHVLGLDDMYNTNNDYSYNTLSYWDIMDSGPYLNSGRTPPSYSAYERFYLNWLTPIELRTSKNITLDTLTTSNKAFLISQTGNHNLNGSNPNPVEFFLLENRQNKGWDSYLPGHGMLATHIYYNPSTWTNNTPNNISTAMGVDIVEADGVASNATLSGDPFPGTSKITSWSPTLRSGTNISKPLTYITEQNGIIKFKFMGGDNVPPTATEATDITIASFVAHWNEVVDASGYYFTAYNLSDGESKFTEGFKNGLVAPTGWTITATATSTSPNYSGDSIPSIVFRNSGELVQTEQYLLPATSLSFVIKTLSGLNGYLLVEGTTGTTWHKVDSIPVTSSLNTTKTYSFTADQNYTQFKLTYTKVTGYLALDDLTVGFSKKLEYNAFNKWVTATSDTLINLASNRDYYYKVKASDKTLNSDNTIKYENITDFSNLIHVQTFENKAKAKTLIAVADSVYIDNTGTINLYIPSTKVSVVVYNLLGQQVRSINPTTNKVEISGLPRNQIYIIKAGQQVTKVIL